VTLLLSKRFGGPEGFPQLIKNMLFKNSAKEFRFHALTKMSIVKLFLMI
jgi:hypothetical protein